MGAIGKATTGASRMGQVTHAPPTGRAHTARDAGLPRRYEPSMAGDRSPLDPLRDTARTLRDTARAHPVALGLAAAAVSAALARPRDRGAPHAPRFARLQTE